MFSSPCFVFFCLTITSAMASSFSIILSTSRDRTLSFVRNVGINCGVKTIPSFSHAHGNPSLFSPPFRVGKVNFRPCLNGRGIRSRYNFYSKVDSGSMNPTTFCNLGRAIWNTSSLSAKSNILQSDESDKLREQRAQSHTAALKRRLNTQRKEEPHSQSILSLETTQHRKGGKNLQNTSKQQNFHEPSQQKDHHQSALQQQQTAKNHMIQQPQPKWNLHPSSRLEPPEIIFSNNHLLVVNKPPGWKSQPGDGGGNNNDSSNINIDPKCLLSALQSHSLGGGSLQNFVIPTHRLDQPCTGVLIFAKNGKAASRVQVAWGKRQVEKCYWVVVEGGRDSMDGLELLRSRSMLVESNARNGAETYRLSAVLETKPVGDRKKRGKSAGRNPSGPRGGRGGRGRGNVSAAGGRGGGSVTVTPILPNSQLNNSNPNNGRVCHIEWKHLLTLPTAKRPNRHLLSVTTDTGAKHQVRALLALAGGAPIAGDLRYGNNNNWQNNYGAPGRVDEPLPDGSVALHARSVFLPTVSLGGMEFLKEEPFVSDIPKSWNKFFGIRENDVKHL